MPNINKVVFGNQTLIDLSTTTLSQASQLANGVTAYDRAGNVITGTASGGGSNPYALVTGEYDINGGKIVHITGAVDETITADSGGGDIDAMSATVLLDLSDDTVDAAHLISGYTAHNSMGQQITGTASPGTAVLGEKTITANGTYNASADSLDGYSSVTVNVPTGTTPTGTKTISISSNGTTTEDVTNYASAEITVNVPTGTARTSADLTASGATVTVPSGLYAEAASKSVASGSAATPATTITANPSISVSASGLITATASASQSVTPSVSAGYVSSGTAGTVSVSGSNTQQLTTQAAATITPTTSSQTAVAAGRYTTGAVTVAAIPSEYIVPSGTKSITENGTGIDVTAYASVDVTVPSSGGMNVQMYNDYDYSTSTSYTATDVTLTVAVSGTYDISWVGWRNTTSGTSGSQLYRNGTAYGSANTTFEGSYGQSVNLTGVSLNAGDVLVVRARARNTSYRMYVANLVIVQTA